ncbi:hypothetical protein BDR06DRAFT_1003053 [Suillus hirtellus]|nr:hypothetical protein BDR06DRAFT_1003053 [Suillus hirtellus]
MYSQLTTPPSSIATSKSPDNSPNSSRWLKSRHLSPKPYERQRAPIGDDSGSSDDELRAPPRIPHVIKNLSYSVKCAKSQLKKSCPNSDPGVDHQEPESQETLENGLRFISIQIVTQAIIAQQAKQEWQRVLALATAWEVEADVQHTTLSQLVLQQDAIRYARTSAEIKFLQDLLSRRNEMGREVDIDAKKKRYQREITAFLAADSQLDQAEGLARDLCQPENHVPGNNNTMEGKAFECELKDRLALNSEPEFDN